MDIEHKMDRMYHKSYGRSINCGPKDNRGCCNDSLQQ